MNVSVSTCHRFVARCCRRNSSVLPSATTAFCNNSNVSARFPVAALLDSRQSFAPNDLAVQDEDVTLLSAADQHRVVIRVRYSA